MLKTENIVSAKKKKKNWSKKYFGQKTFFLVKKSQKPIFLSHFLVKKTFFGSIFFYIHGSFFEIKECLIKTTGQRTQLTDQFSLTHQFYDCFVYNTSRRYWYFIIH